MRYPNEAFLKELGVTEVKQRFSSQETQYVIGKVRVDALLKNDLNDREDVFVAKWN